jgi:hypothetical protein
MEHAFSDPLIRIAGALGSEPISACPGSKGWDSTFLDWCESRSNNPQKCRLKIPGLNLRILASSRC